MISVFFKEHLNLFWFSYSFYILYRAHYFFQLLFGSEHIYVDIVEDSVAGYLVEHLKKYSKAPSNFTAH